MAASMTLDMGNTDKQPEIRVKAERLDIQGRAAVGQLLGRAVFEVEYKTFHRRARSAQNKRLGRRWTSIITARGEKAVHRLDRLRLPDQSARKKQAGAGKPLRLLRLRYARAQPGAGERRRQRDHVDRERTHEAFSVGQNDSSAACRAADHHHPRRRAPARLPTSCSANTTPSASSVGHPLDENKLLLQ